MVLLLAGVFINLDATAGGAENMRNQARLRVNRRNATIPVSSKWLNG